MPDPLVDAARSFSENPSIGPALAENDPVKLAGAISEGADVHAKVLNLNGDKSAIADKHARAVAAADKAWQLSSKMNA